MDTFDLNLHHDNCSIYAGRLFTGKNGFRLSKEVTERNQDDIPKCEEINLVSQNAPSSSVDAPKYGAFVRVIKKMVHQTIQSIRFGLAFNSFVQTSETILQHESFSLQIPLFFSFEIVRLNQQCQQLFRLLSI